MPRLAFWVFIASVSCTAFGQSGPTLPQGGKFTAGLGTIGQASNGSLGITQSSNRGVIDWSKFSIGAGGRVFINNGSGATLNRVTGGDLSYIGGLLKATGSLYLINPNGVVIGSSGRVLSGGSFFGSTRNIGTDPFMAGGALAASGNSAGDIVNRGAITAREGDVVLIARSVENSGSIAALNGTATLVVGNTVLLTTVGGPAGVYVTPDASASGTLTQTGRIQAAAAALKAAGGDIYSLAGNRSGLISATGSQTINGEVWLSAPNGTVTAGGNISARNADGSGGRIVANGAQVSIGSDAHFSATGTSGGTVLLGVSALGGTDLAKSTTVASGASILAGGPLGGGSVETSGHAVSIGAATIGAGVGGLWRVDPVDLTIDTSAATTIATSLNGGTNVSEITTATNASGAGTQSAGNGDINVAAPITWTGAGALSLSAYHNLNVNAAISGTGSLTGTAGNAVAVNANVSANNVLMTASGGNLTLASGVTVAGGNGVTLETTGHFVNNAGSSALSGGTGNWLVYSTNPTTDTTGGLTPNFLQYAANGGAAPAAAGNGLLYSATPSLSVGLFGTLEKTYDGTTAATFTNANSTVSGLINSDTAAVTGTYGSKNAGIGISVTASNIAVSHSGLPVYGYTGTTPSTSASIGQIDAATLTASIIGDPTKVYNGTTTATLFSGNYQVSGFAPGEGATVNQPSSVAYDSASAGARTVSAAFSATNFVPIGGANFSNYVLPTSATGTGTIYQAPLVISGVLATDKTYDRTTADTLTTGAAALHGVIGSDNVNLVTSGGTGTFSTVNAGSGLSVTASGFTLSGSKAANYWLFQPTGLTASINKANLTVSGVSAIGKVYDSTNTATLDTSSATLNGVVPGDTMTLGTGSATGLFANADVGTGIGVNASGFNFSGSGSSNYQLAQPNGLSANITAKPVFVAITSTPIKTYNGDAGAVVSPSDFQVTGFISGQSATIGQTAHVSYATTNAGTQNVTATLAVSDYLAGSGTKLSDYTLPTSATVSGVINAAPVTISINGNPTKTYNGTTAAALTSSNYLLSGFLAGQSATVMQNTGVYSSANAGVRQVSATLAAGNFSAGPGTLLSNYAFPTTAIGSGTILPAPIAGGIYAAITGNPTKTYDGTTAALLTSSNFLLSGFTSGNGASVTQTVGTYSDKNVGVQAVTASLAPINFTPNAGTNLSNYTLPTFAYGSGTINPAVLTASILGSLTKVYNGTTRASVTGSNFSISGVASGEGVSIGNTVQVAYDAPQAGSRTVTASIALTDITAQSGTLLSNYVLPTSATGAGQITQAPVSVVDVAALNKTYDTTATAQLFTGSAHLFGVVGSDNVTLSSIGANGVFTSANAGNSIPVTASGFNISGTDVANYQLFQPTGLTATIYRAPLSLSGVTAVNKNYDNTFAGTLNTGSAGIVGVLPADSGQVTLDASGATAAFSSVNVGNNLAVSAGGFGIIGGQAANYSLSQPTGLTANISAAPLTASIIGNPTKVYDGSTSTTLTASNYQLNGFVSGQSATLPQSATAQYLSPNAGIEGIQSTLASSDFLAGSGTNLSNYVLPTTGSGTGTITQAPLAVSIVGNPTKTYDSTTAATLASNNYSLRGFISGQSATVTQTAGLYGVADAGTRSVTATLATGDFTAGGATNMSNYSLPTSATGSGTITKAPLQVVSVYGTNRNYNGGLADTLNVSTATVSGLFGSDAVTLNTGAATGALVSKDVGTGIGVTGAGFTMSGGQSADYTLAQPTGLSADITQSLLNLTNVTRVYNSTSGLPGASSSYTLSGIFGSDVVSMNTSGITGNYVDKNVGTGKSVSLSGLALAGAQAADYSIASSLSNATIGTITKAPLTVLGVVANNKVYDATTAATLDNSSDTLGGLFGGDAVTLNTAGATGTFANKNVGAAKAVTATGYTVSNTDAGNYTFTQPTGLTANITQYSGVSLASVTKIYDGGLALPGSASAYVLSGLLSSDSVQVATGGLSGGYTSANVGSGLSLNLSGLALGGTDAANYSIGSTLSNATIGTINPKTLTAAITGTPTKTYDTTTAATLSSGNYSLNGFVTGESATVTKTSGIYSSSNAGTPTVSTTLVSGDFNPGGGTLLTNYTLPASASGAGKINKAPLTITGVLATDKTYNGATADTLNTTSATLSGVLPGDSGLVTLNSASAAGTFVSANVGTGISVTASAFATGGLQSGNYLLAQPTGLLANITQATLNLASVNKVYDATAAAVGTGVSYTLSGIFGSDSVSLNTSGLAGSYVPGKNVGTGLGVSMTGLALTGAKAADYSIATSVTNDPIGTITRAPLSITGPIAVNKVYDGTNTAVINNSSDALNGVLGSDVVSILSSPNSGTFSSSNAGTSTVTAAGSYSVTGADASNYNLSQPVGLSAAITQAPLTISIVSNPSKIYDNTATATLASSNYSLLGFVGSQSATVTQTAGAYDSSNAGSRTVTALVSGHFTQGAGTLLSNYALPGTASGPGTIGQRTVTVSITGNPTKTYDGGAAATLIPGNYTLGGFVGGQGATVSQTAATYNSANAGSRTLSATLGSGYFSAVGGANFANYILPNLASGTGTINQAPLTAAISGTPTKIYNGTTVATLASTDYTLSGFITGQGANVTQTVGTYNSANAGSQGVTATLSGGNFSPTGGTTLSNYSLPTTASGTGAITQKTLTAAIINDPTKTYDGGAAAILSPSSYTLNGFIGGQGATVTQTAGTYDISDAGSRTVTAPLPAGDFTPTGGANLSNYVLPTTASGAGTINQQTLTAAITGNPTKIYDGATAATLASGNYTLTGFVAGQGATITQTTGAYASPDAGSRTVTATLGSGDLTQNIGTNLSNYTLPTSASGAGTISQKTLSASITSDPTKTYDGGTAATLNSGSYTLNGFIGGQGVTVTQTAGTYDLSNAGARTVTATLPSSDFTATGGANLSNYVLPTAASGPGAITQKTLTAAITADPTKTYDGGTAATLNSGNYTLSGFIGGQGATVTQTAGRYDTSDAGSRTVTAALPSGDFTAMGGANLSNYVLPTTASGAGTINQQGLTAAITGNPTKTYDGGTTATLVSGEYTLTGFIAGQGATVTQTSGTYVSADAGSRTVTATLASGDLTQNSGTNLANYTLPTSASGSGTINQKTLSASVVGNPTKTYDGSNAALLNPSSYTLSGFIGGQGATVSQTAGTYNNSDAGLRTVTATLPAGDFTATGGANFSNYILPTTASGAGTINQQGLTAAITGNPTKTYDGATGATLASGDYTLTGFITGQGATVTQTAGTYGSPDAGLRTVTATLGSGDLTQNIGTNLSNYTLPTSASGPGTIGQKTLTASITSDPTKIYDGGNAATLNSGSYTLSGFVGGQGATISQTAGTYDLSEAGSRTVTATLPSGDFTAAGGTNLSNYVLPTVASGPGGITQKTLTASITGDPTKTYDGGTAATLSASNYALSGFIGGQGATVTQTAGTYDTSDAGSRTVTAVLPSGDFTPTSGANLSNYILPTTALGTGTINQQALTAAITGNPTKTYDGGTTATLVPGDYTLTGFIAGQGATVTQTAGTYASADAGSRNVTATLASGDLTQNSGTNLSNYTLPSNASCAGTINQKALSASVTGNPSKTYDGSNTATLDPSSYTLNGFIGGQGATVTQTAGTYDTSDAGSRTVTATLPAGDFTPTGGANFSNYILPTTASGAGTINQQGLTAAITGNPTKTYDGATSATLGSGDYTLTGFIAGQGATVTQTAGNYASADAGSRTVTATLGSGDLTQNNGTNLSNYTLPTSASGSGTINQKSLSATITGNPTRTYDGTMDAALGSANYSVSGFIGGQSATINQSAGTYDSANAGGRAVTASLSNGNFTGGLGTLLSNYTLPTSATGPGTIDQKALTASITADPSKTYDGGTAATLSIGNYALSGFILGQGATVTQTAGTYDTSDAGSRTVTATLNSVDFTQNGGTSLSNYALPTAASGTGNITQKALGAAISGNPTRTYDATNTATLTPSDYTLSGFVTGQGATVTQTSGTYDLADAGSRTVAATLASGDFAQIGGTNLANYILPTSASGGGTITQKSLTAAITGNPTRTYDATTGAVLVSSDFALGGFVGNQGATVTRTSGTYDISDAGSRTVTAALGSGNFVQTAGTNLGNYVLPTTASGAGTISQKALTAAIIGNPTRAYDGSTAATLTPSDYIVAGFVPGQGANIMQAAGVYDSANAGNRTVATSLTSGDFAQNSGTNLLNYVLPTAASGAGLIDPKTLTAAITGNPTKTYDGATAGAIRLGDYTLTGFIPGEGAVVTQTSGTYEVANAGPQKITTTLQSGDFTQNGGTSLSNYILPASASGMGTINQRTLAAIISGRPAKTYDGSTAATVTSNDYTISGFVSGQNATLTDAAGFYNSPNAGLQPVTSILQVGNFRAATGTNLGNYILPSSAQGIGSIGQRPVTVTIVGTPTKVNDGSLSATLSVGNYAVSGFLAGQGATVNQTAATYDSLDVGSRTVTAILAPLSFNPNAGTLLSNYFLPLLGSGPGAITPAILTKATTLTQAIASNMIIRGLAPATQIATAAARAVYGAVVPRTYIPYPAPSTLSTWQNNGFGSLPTIVSTSSAYVAASESSDGVTSTGSPIINTTEQILLQGGKNKSWRVLLPPTTPTTVLSESGH